MNDKEIVAALRAGGQRAEAAFDELYRCYSKRLWGLFSSHGIPAGLIEDAVADTFEKVLRNIHNYRGDAPLEHWLMRIASNQHKMFWRAASTRLEETTYQEKLDRRTTCEITNPALPDELKKCVQKAFDTLANTHHGHATALRMIGEHGLDLHEVACRLGKSYGATREYISQARKRLKPLLQPCLTLLG